MMESKKYNVFMVKLKAKTKTKTKTKTRVESKGLTKANKKNR